MAKVLLLELANEESKHQQLFSNLKETDLFPDGVPADFNLSLKEYAAPPAMKDDARTKDVVLCAIDRETRAIAFYTALAELGGNMRKPFEFLAEAERAHKRRLEEFRQEHILVWD